MMTRQSNDEHPGRARLPKWLRLVPDNFYTGNDTLQRLMRRMHLWRIERSVAVLRDAVEREDAALLPVLFPATRRRLELLRRHYDIPATRALADRLAGMGEELDAIAGRSATLDAQGLTRRIGDWFQQLRALRSDLLSASQRPLYLRGNLERWLGDNP